VNVSGISPSDYGVCTDGNDIEDTHDECGENAMVVDVEQVGKAMK
jgi:hypothetical protein